MEEKDPTHTPPRPGLAEAIHPEIGNGALYEKDAHAFLLKSPDPLKELDARLLDHETQANILRMWTGSETNPEPEANHQPDLKTVKEPPNIPEENQSQVEFKNPVVSELEIDLPSVESTFENRREPKAKKKVKQVRKDIEPTTSDDTPPISEPVKGKAPKAGKLVRKAAKSVKRKEAETQSQQKSEPLAAVDLELSPFTHWLKSLRGSDYVHPYDDDFALNQGTGTGKDAISETYADLLAVQGYKEQAVEMYLKLMEKYPGKSGFFAAKIEALQ